MQLAKPTHTVDVSDTNEAKEALEAAEKLGLKFRDATVRGAWEYTEDVDIARHADCQIDNIGHKWFYLTVTGKTIKCKPTTSRLEHQDSGTLTLRFD